MGSDQGYLDFKRKNFIYKSAEHRLNNYEEYLILRDDLEIKKQAARCMECETPYCHALGCPIMNRIPEWNELVFRGDYKGAYESLIQTNCFPEFTGRICPALCESACSLSINLSPVTIKQLEMKIIEKAFKNHWVKPIMPEVRQGKSVAVIGSGPSGLSAAYWLNQMGYNVTVYEQSDEIGGLMRYGIPNFKFSKKIIDRRVVLMAQEGIRFKTNVSVGKDLGMDALRKAYDAVLLCIGAGEPRDMPIEGRDAEGIYFALNYLKQATEFVLGKRLETEILSAKGKKVLVIGGGDTGADCVGTAIRQGATTIRQIEIMPEPIEWLEDYNPIWPDYPRGYKMPTAHAERCDRDYSVNVNRFLVERGHVTGAHCTRVEWRADGKNGYSFTEIPDSGFVIEADLVVLAMGFTHVEHAEWLEALGVRYNNRGNIEIGSNYETTIPGVFAAGDASTGASLVCHGINNGKLAAAGIQAYLMV